MNNDCLVGKFLANVTGIGAMATMSPQEIMDARGFTPEAFNKLNDDIRYVLSNQESNREAHRAIAFDKYVFEGQEFSCMMDVLGLQSQVRNIGFQKKKKEVDLGMGNAMKGMSKLANWTQSNFKQVEAYIGRQEFEIGKLVTGLQASSEEKIAIVADNIGVLETHATAAFKKFAEVIMENKDQAMQLITRAAQ